MKLVNITPLGLQQTCKHRRNMREGNLSYVRLPRLHSHQLLTRYEYMQCVIAYGASKPSVGLYMCVSLVVYTAKSNLASKRLLTISLAASSVELCRNRMGVKGLGALADPAINHGDGIPNKCDIFEFETRAVWERGCDYFVVIVSKRVIKSFCQVQSDSFKS